MGTGTEILGALFLAFFASNALLSRSAGLDSAERFSRGKSPFLPLAVVIVFSAFVSHLISFAVLNLMMPAFGVSPSTLLDGTVIVFSTIASSAALEAASNKWLPKLADLFGGNMFTVGYNSAVAGIVLLSRAASTDFGKSIIYCAAFSAAVVIMYAALSAWRLDIKEYRLPRAFRGAPILFILLGLAAMVFGCYSGAALPF